jgi:hypothetical protein
MRRLRVPSHRRMFIIPRCSVDPGLNPVAGYPDGIFYDFSQFLQEHVGIASQEATISFLSAFRYH